MTVMLPQHLPRQLSRLARAMPGDTVGPGPAGDRRSPEATPPIAGPGCPGRPMRRVRHEVRDGVAVIAFSAAASTGLAMLFVLLVRVAG
jgi:hypothetical protein